jgi:outer membrane protein
MGTYHEPTKDKSMQLSRQIALALALTGMACGGAQAHQAGDWVVRFGAATVEPDVDSDTQAGVTVTYMLKDWFGIELLAATPFEHDLYLEDTLLGRTRIGETKHLPPTVLAQFSLPGYGRVRPYAGIGVNYTRFFGERIDDGVVSPLIGGADADLHLSNSWGLAAELGVDVALSEGWFLNLSAWKMDLDTEARLTVNGTTVDKVDVAIDPLVWMVGVGRAF